MPPPPNTPSPEEDLFEDLGSLSIGTSELRALYNDRYNTDEEYTANDGMVELFGGSSPRPSPGTSSPSSQMRASTPGRLPSDASRMRPNLLFPRVPLVPHRQPTTFGRLPTSSREQSLPPPTTTSKAAQPHVPLDYQALHYVDEVDDTLMCPICRTPFHEPITTKRCGHTFCTECLRRAVEIQPTCPIDRQPIAFHPDQLCNPRIVGHQLDRLKVRCPNAGCGVVTTRGSVKTHYDRDCPQTLVACPQPTCDKGVARVDLAIALVEEEDMHDPRAAAAAVAEQSFGNDQVAEGQAGEGAKKALVKYDYRAAGDREITLVRGQFVTNITMADAVWWTGTNEQGDSGIFPRTFVELVEDDDASADHAAPTPTPAPRRRCIHMEIKCRYCAKEILLTEREKHYETECEGHTIPCAECDTAVVRHRMETHLSTQCLDAQTVCKFQPHGCRMSGKRKDVQSHEEVGCAYEAIGKLIQDRAEDRAIINNLRGRLTAIEALRTSNHSRSPRPRAVTSLQIADLDLSDADTTSQPLLGEVSNGTWDSPEDYMLAQFERIETKMEDLRKSLTELDGRHSMMLLNEMLPLKDAITELRSNMGVISMHTTWLMNVQRQNRMAAGGGGAAGAGASAAGTGNGSGTGGTGVGNARRDGEGGIREGERRVNVVPRRMSGENPPRL